MKRFYILLFFILIFLSSCSSKVDLNIKEKSVDVKLAKTEKREIYVETHGTITAKNMKKYSFQTGGVLSEIPVKVGDVVKSGDLLASLDKKKFDIAVDASEAQQNQAYNDYAKAKESYDYYSKELSDIKVLYESGATSKSNYDQVKLRADIARKELLQASAQYDASKSQGDLNKSRQSDTNLVSDIDGEVLKIIGSVGEVVGAGYPVVIVGSSDKEVIVGLSKTDKSVVEVGREAVFQSEDKIYRGVVESISGLPDMDTLSYEVKISFDSLDEFSIGQLVSPKILLEKKEGIWLGISNILNDGRDYLFVVSEEKNSKDEVEYRAEKRYINVLFRDIDKLLVSGVNDGEYIITSGTSSLSDGYKVSINSKN